MKKIPTMFVRDTSGKRPVITPEWHPECLWVRDGEGVATRKWDGSACLVRNGFFYRRLEWDIEKGPAPVTWLHHSFDPAQRSGHGWMLVGEGPDDWMHRKVFAQAMAAAPGTYELCGPKVNKNREKMNDYVLLRHGDTQFDVVRTFEGVHDFMLEHVIEGLVFHHPDGRMAKIKRRDFVLPW